MKAETEELLQQRLGLGDREVSEEAGLLEAQMAVDGGQDDHVEIGAPEYLGILDASIPIAAWNY